MLIRVTDATEWNGNGVKMPRKYEKFKPPFDFVQKKMDNLKICKETKNYLFIILKKILKRRFRGNIIRSINLQAKLIEYALLAATLISLKNLQTRSIFTNQN